MESNGCVETGCDPLSHSTHSGTMEGGSTIELQFRSGEDLFKNYSIGIIRQVVDKSEYATPFHAF